jgi:renalase
VVVVGAGIAGVACARVLAAVGHEVQVRDRGRAVGGRMASRALRDRRVDTGASYLTARDPRFAAVVEDWVDRGLARPWTDAFATYGPDGWGTTSRGPVRFGAAGGLRSLVEDLASGLDVRLGVEVTAVGEGPQVDGDAADLVVVALPDPQADRVLQPDLPAERAAVEGRRWEPVLALTAGWPERAWDVDGVFVDSPVLAWVADDGRRRGDGSPVLVAHSTGAFAEPRLDDPAAAAPALTAAVRELLDLPEPAWRTVSRWSFARPAEPRDAPFHLGEAGVGLCGDGWGSPKVETAWLSGTLLGHECARRLA